MIVGSTPEGCPTMESMGKGVPTPPVHAGVQAEAFELCQRGDWSVGQVATAPGNVGGVPDPCKHHDVRKKFRPLRACAWQSLEQYTLVGTAGGGNGQPCRGMSRLVET
jgi:hypothetical protein